jgi:hypothetical protein
MQMSPAFYEKRIMKNFPHSTFSAWRKAALAAGKPSISFKPLGYLWPWILVDVLFFFFISSPQGHALATDLQGRPSDISLVAALLLGFLITFLGCFLTSVAIKGQPNERPTTNEDLAHQRRNTLTTHAIWITTISLSPSLIFSIKTQSLAAAITSALLAIGIFLISRSMLSRLNEAYPKWHTLLELTYRHRIILTIFVLGLSIIPLISGAAISIKFPTALSHLGPLIVSLLGTSALATFFGAIFIAIPASLERPWLGTVFLIAIFFIITFSPFKPDTKNPLLDNTTSSSLFSKKSEKNECTNEVHDQLHSPVFERVLKGYIASDEDKDPQLYLISAEGGGIRAAYWTAMGLAELDIATNGQFGNQIASLSGVSGGSFGIAAWVGARQIQERTPLERKVILERFLSGDFLSPIIGGLLFLDAPRLILGPLWFNARRDHVFEKAIVDHWKQITGDDFFVRPLNKLCLRGFRDKPVLTFNSMDALTGTRVLLNNTKQSKFQNTRLIEAIHMSARFPFLSPGAELDGNEEIIEDISRELRHNKPNISDVSATKEAIDVLGPVFSRKAILVDGGYYDNTGLHPTRLILEKIKQEIGRDVKATPIHFVSSPDTACLKLQKDQIASLSTNTQHILSLIPEKYKCRNHVLDLEKSLQPRIWQWITTPFDAMFSARESHAKDERNRVINQLSTMPEQNKLIQLSFSDEISIAYGSGEKIGKSRWIPANIKKNYEKGLSDFMRMEDTVRSVSNADYQKQITLQLGRSEKLRKKYAMQYERMMTMAERSACIREHELRLPPLGWTLNKQDQRLLSCLAISAAAKIEDFYLIPLPFPPPPAQTTSTQAQEVMSPLSNSPRLSNGCTRSSATDLGAR